MLRRNQDVPTGLVNGAMGTVTGFEWPMLAQSQLNQGKIPDAVLIEFDDKTIATKYLDKVSNLVRIRPLCVNFDGKELVLNFKLVLNYF